MKFLAFAALVLAATPALAQTVPDNEPAGAPNIPNTVQPVGPANTPKVNQLIIYGDDPCPSSSDQEIIVCARKPESERYRIPENLRELGSVQTQAWTNKATELSYVGRTGTDSCSTVGAGGFTGCLNQIIGAARADRENRDSVDWNTLIEDARQARLGQIDTKSEEIEQEQVNRERASQPQ